MPLTSRFLRKAISPFQTPLVAWSAWLRLVALVPALAMLWLGVAWALSGSPS